MGAGWGCIDMLGLHFVQLLVEVANGFAGAFDVHREHLGDNPRDLGRHIAFPIGRPEWIQPKLNKLATEV